jgi:hypothetical protein
MLTNTGTASERWPGDAGNSPIGRFDRAASQKSSGSVLKSPRPCNPSDINLDEINSYLTKA